MTICNYYLPDYKLRLNTGTSHWFSLIEWEKKAVVGFDLLFSNIFFSLKSNLSNNGSR